MVDYPTEATVKGNSMALQPDSKGNPASNEAQQFDCRVSYVLDLLSARWTVSILRELFIQPVRSRRFLTLVPGLNMKTLRQRLQMLEDHDLITRTVFADKPLRVEYSLTEKGRELYQIMIHIKSLGEHWLSHQCQCPFNEQFQPNEIACPLRSAVKRDSKT